MCLNGIRDYPYQANIRKFTAYATQGAQNSVPWTWRSFCGLSPPNKASMNPKFECETLEISVVFINPCSVLSCNL